MTALPALAFNGVTVRDRGEMLSLTDLWKAAGSDPSRKPAEWLRSADADRFIAFLAEVVGVAQSSAEVGKSHFGLVQVSKGGADRGATFAHWQLGMAYAKYLDPGFHAACNVIVRERMQGARALAPVPAAAMVELQADDAALIRRTDGIARQLSGKVAQMERTLDAIRARLEGAIANPAVHGTVLFKPALSVCAAAPAKRRRGLVHRVSARLLRYSVQNGHPLAEEPFTGRRMFHVDAIKGWLAAEGRLLLSQHIADMQGAPVLPFKPKAA